MNVKGMKKGMMIKKTHRDLARRLVLKAIESYKQKFILKEDLLSGEEKRMILQQIDDIAQGIKEDREGMYKRKYMETKQRLEHLASLEDCDEEFEM